MLLRRNKHHSKKVVSAVMAGLMVMGSGSVAAYAAGENTSITAGAPNLFSDVANGYWGEKYIYQLAAQGIVMGNNGKFRPNDPVTQQEAVTMAIRFLNMNVSVSTGTSTALPTNMKVNNYFVPYVQLALQQSLLDRKKESDYKDEKVIWGANKASREWITEVLIRSIGRTSDANAAMNQATGFADNAKISVDRLGYVNAAVELGLAKGVNGNKFDPQGAVTRAQLATFFSRAQAYIDAQYENQYEGYVTSISSDKIELYTDGQNRSFPLLPTTATFEKSSEKRLAISDIKPYTQVTVIAKNGAASYLEILDPEQKVESFERKYARLSPNNVIWFDTDNSFEELSYDSSTLFMDQNGNKIDPNDAKALVPGSVVTVERETFSPQKRVVAIRVKNGLVNKTAAGIIQAVDNTSKTITFRDGAGTLVETFNWNDSTLIQYQNQLLNPAELKAGSIVSYTVENSVLKKVEINQSVDRTVTAMLYAVEKSGKTVTYKRNGSTQLETKFLAEKPELAISGIAQPVLDDLIPDATAGDQVELTINGEEKVTRIAVLGRQMEVMNQATVVRYDSAKNWLMVSDSEGKPQVIVLDSKTKLDSSAGSTLSAVEGLLGAGRKVNIKHLGNRALSLEIVYKYDGRILDINTTSKTISILTLDGQTVKIPYSNPSVELYSKQTAALSDLKVGDEVSAQLSANQDLLASLKSKTSLQFEVTATEPSLNRIRVSNEGVTSMFYTDKAQMTDENGQMLRISDLRQGSLINVQFVGTTPVVIQEVKLTLGQIVSVDAAGNSLTVKAFNGANQPIVISGAVKVIRGGAVSSSLSSLTTNDRVEVRKDIDGTTIVKVLDSLSRSFWRYENGDILVKRTYTTDDYRFRAASNVFVHQNDQNLSVQSLKENDNIVLYFSNGSVVEVVKQ
ncbi:S-layer homology domain-containing protein [Paenibacillus lemnae]|uniref:S-layer homology domain-containing protein n=1 Tax=Paenibacillus lemnae TaxID=1330551 RepID=A0A848MCW4_PAELE|nr:S-layer homology domain-containing protein [Paenibacillus lemnae]NMO97980.1 S-layer homology domain-containing protein [Paenibacillus lemnae]